MNRELRRALVPLVGATIALVVMLGAHPFSTTRIVAGYVLALATIVTAWLVRILRSTSDMGAPSEFQRALAHAPETDARPSELVRIERELLLGMASEGHLHRRLVPLLREAAAARGGLDPATLDADAWELLRPDRPAPANRTAPGITIAQLRSLVAALEAL